MISMIRSSSFVESQKKKKKLPSLEKSLLSSL